MPPAEPPPASDLGTPQGGATRPAWPDVSKTSRGYRVPAGIGGGLVVLLTGVVAVGLVRGPANDRGSAAAPAGSRPAVGVTDSGTSGRAPAGLEFLDRNDCLSVSGPGADPVVKVVPCGPGTLQVVERFDGTAATGTCRELPTVSSWYSRVDPVDSADSFVLCLRRWQH